MLRAGDIFAAASGKEAVQDAQEMAATADVKQEEAAAAKQEPNGERHMQILKFCFCSCACSSTSRRVWFVSSRGRQLDLSP